MVKDLEGKLGKKIKGKEPLMLTQGLAKDEENDTGDKEEEESVKKNGKALALVTPPAKKAI